MNSKRFKGDTIMENKIFLKMIGLLFLMWFSFIMGVITITNTNVYKKGIFSVEQIEQCEKELPRNVFCEIIAVPIEKN